MQRIKILLISASILLLASACGQKGPLYLPDAETPQTQNSDDPERKQKEQDGERNETHP